MVKLVVLLVKATRVNPTMFVNKQEGLFSFQLHPAESEQEHAKTSHSSSR